MEIPHKIEVDLIHNPAIPLLSIYPEKNKILKVTYTQMLNAALFIIVKTWKKPRCPLTH